MTAPLFPASTSTVAAATIGVATHVTWILICSVVALIAVIRVLRRPTDEWAHSTWSKIGWILVVLYLAIPVAGYPIPIGAAAAIRATRRPPSNQPGQLPYADGGTLDSK